MNEFFLILVITTAVFGLLAAGLALREHRHPGTGVDDHAAGCTHSGKRIKCLQCPSRSDDMDNLSQKRG